MTSFLISALAFVVALSLLVAVHEYGHFWVARRLGIKVLRFSIGFGKPLLRRTMDPKDPVEFVISAIPLGGYVKLLDEREGPVPASEQHRAFNRQSPGRRIAVLVAGPAFNFAFAALAYWVMFLTGVPALKPIMGDITPGSAAAEAGIVRGDEIVAVDGRATPTLMDAQLAMLESIVVDGEIDVTVRGEDGAEQDATLRVAGSVTPLTEPGALLPGLGLSLWRPDLPVVIGELTEGEAAQRSGLREGDRVLTADGETMDEWSTWVRLVRERPGRVVPLEVERDGRVIEMDLAVGIATDNGKTIGRIGAGPAVPEGLYDRIRTEQRFGPLEAVGEAVGKVWEMSALTVHMLYRMITGDVSIKNLSGPINIAQTAGYTATIGPQAFLSFLGIVSISLGILNLLPIPMLDGGQIVYQVAEIMKGSPVSERTQIIGQQIGILLLLLLTTFAFYNDIARLAG